MSMHMDAVLNWSLYITIGSCSIRLSSPGSMTGVLLIFLLCGSFVMQIQWGDCSSGIPETMDVLDSPQHQYGQPYLGSPCDGHWI
jgi:mannose/fructose/N-acetylgalactosamine-specific phosphotransferase system component IID